MERVEPFVRRCEDFFASCHQPSGSDLERVRTLARDVAGIYAEALRLPDVPAEVRVADVARVEFEVAFAAIAQAFPALTNYWSCEETLDTSRPAHVMVRDSVEDVTDLYLDLREAYEHWVNGNEQHATWHWRYMFQRHWGRVALRLQLALQDILVARGAWLD